MKKPFSLQAPLATVIAIASGVIMLATYILPMKGLRQMILEVVVIGAAAALLIGVMNLLSVHAQKMQESDSALNSAALVIALVVTFGITVGQEIPGYPTWLPDSQWLLSNIQIPVESALMGVLAVTLTYAAARLVAQRMSVFSFIFVLALLIALLTGTSFGLQTGAGQLLRSFLSYGLASAGARGILIGVALGTIATGLRILMGSDRPYGG